MDLSIDTLTMIKHRQIKDGINHQGKHEVFKEPTFELYMVDKKGEIIQVVYSGKPLYDSEIQ